MTRSTPQLPRSALSELPEDHPDVARYGRESAIGQAARSWDLPPWTVRHDGAARRWVATAPAADGLNLTLDHEDLPTLREKVRALRGHLLVVP